MKKVVHLSACAVLGHSWNKDDLIDESACPHIPKSNVYAYTKAKAEEIVREYAKRGLDASIANPATVYGPGDRKMNSGSIIKAIYDNTKGQPGLVCALLVHMIKKVTTNRSVTMEFILILFVPVFRHQVAYQCQKN